MYPAMEPFHGVLENEVKAVPVTVVEENRISGIAAENDVVVAAGIMDARFSCHALNIPSNARKSSLTP